MTAENGHANHHDHQVGHAAKSNKSELRSGAGGHSSHKAGHAGMVDDYRRRFWLALALTIPVLVLSPMVRDFVGQGMARLLAGEEWIALSLSSVIYFWAGWPFLKGAGPEIRAGRPGNDDAGRACHLDSLFLLGCRHTGTARRRAVLLGTGHARHDHAFGALA